MAELREIEPSKDGFLWEGITVVDVKGAGPVFFWQTYDVLNVNLSSI